ncbi:hypothetical protein KA047_00305 [Candidatus Saccharibacteria bacterium]|jgi:hypothetical protein|nr:hypothetical protein [Candidatus Saccharibacteria bacterium]
MTNQEVIRLANELDSVGHALTSFEQLGIDNFGALAADVQAVVSQNDQLQPDRAQHRIGMVMCKDEASKQAGARLVKPVVEVLFEGNEQTLPNWVPYTVNHYEEGHFFSPHQDYLDGTVMIVTVTGVREIDIYSKELEDDVFREVEATHTLNTGSIMLLNGYVDLGHAARCIVGPSISVVGDVSERIHTRSIKQNR